jgi:hypothetical protein
MGGTHADDVGAARQSEDTFLTLCVLRFKVLHCTIHDSWQL